jgi:putative MATE family efflux protein
MKEKQQRRKLLGEEKIPRLIFKMSVPAMIGMTVNALYNLIDTIFIGQGVGALAIGGLSIAFSAQIAMFAIGLMIGTGTASIVSRALGADEPGRAARTAGTAWSSALIIVIVMLTLAQIFLKPLVRLLGATAEIAPYTEEYLRTILFGFPVIAATVIGHAIVRAEGKPQVAMISLLIGASANIALDALFIFGFNMGIRGAATATVIARTFSLIFIIFYFKSGKSVLPLSLKCFIPRLHAIKPIFALGLPAFIRQIGMSVLLMVVNNSLGSYGSPLHISAYGVISRFMLFSMMPMFGLNQGFQPVAGFNWGAGNSVRVRKSLAVTTAASVTYASILYIFVLTVPHLIFRIFTPNQALIDIGSGALRTVFLLLPLIGIQLVGATFFLAIGKALPAFILALSRQIIFLIPLVLILPVFFGVPGIWASFPLADGLSITVTILLLLWQVKKMKAREE